MDLKVCGLPLDAAEGDKEEMPLSALVIVKTFAPEGEVGVRYIVRATDGLSDVEAYGMAMMAAHQIKQGGSFAE
jgi:hypothetical protein